MDAQSTQPLGDEMIARADLSGEARAALRGALRDALSDEARRGAPPDHGRAPLRRELRLHARLLAAVINARILVVPVMLILAMVAVIATVSDTYALTAVAAGAAIVAVVLIAELIVSMMRETEHVSPETAALLEAEGVVDPDRLFSELLADRRALTAATPGVPAH